MKLIKRCIINLFTTIDNNLFNEIKRLSDSTTLDVYTFFMMCLSPVPVSN